MFNRRRWAIIGIALALTAWLSGEPWGALAQQPAAPAATLPTATLWIETDRGRHAFDVEVAETPEARQTGLQNRRFLAADAGMLFDLGGRQPVSMWMKDTFLSLDMLFIDSDGTVVQVAESTRPLSLDIIRSERPVRAVLELLAGTSARLGIRQGSRVYGTRPFPRDAPR